MATAADGAVDGPRTAAERRAVLHRLRYDEIRIAGRVAEASNVALLVEVAAPRAGEGAGEPPMWAIYKPVRGERPLWDFPDGTLAGREVASWLLADATAYGIVPPTVLREGPFGPGSVQLWIGDPYARPEDSAFVVRLARAGQRPAGWLTAFEGARAGGRGLAVVHEDAEDVRDAAVLDALLNNSDRKGSHLVRDRCGTLWGFDHGLTLHAEPKLRTVLWGWAGQPLRGSDLDRLRLLRADLSGSPLRSALEGLLPAGDVFALQVRVQRLLDSGRHPRAGPDWPAIPWPPL